MVGLDRNKLKRLFASAGIDVRIDKISVVLTAALENGDMVTPYLKFSDCTSVKLPRFLLPLEQWKKYSSLPHVDPDGGICAFDHTSSSVDPRFYEEAIVSTAIKTIETLNNTVSGRCLQDFNDELETYWAYKSRDSLLSFVGEWTDKPMIFNSFPLRSEIAGFLGVARENELDKYRRLSSTQLGVENGWNEEVLRGAFVSECLYIPFTKPLSYPIVDTVCDWYRTISECTSYLESYEEFLAKPANAFLDDPFIICGIPSGGLAVVAFQHPHMPRVAQASLSDLVEGGFGFEKVTFFTVHEMSQERLFARGGIGEVHKLNACLVGCGSVGGHLAVALMDAGVTDFTLVDYDNISVENIARHTCGFESVGQKKTDALKRRIEGHNPNCVCKALHKDGLKLALSYDFFLKNVDMVFITAADAPLEYSFVAAYVDGTMSKPIALLWMEPYSLAAHAIVLNKPARIYEELFDREMEFNGRVVENSSQMYKRDAGCNSMYMPYSGLDTQSFVIAFVRQLFAEYVVDKDRNYLFTWMGAISMAAEYGAKISSIYQGVSDYSMISREI